MPTTEDKKAPVYNYRGGQNENLLKDIGFATDQPHLVYLSGIFVLLSNIEGIKRFLDFSSKYLFPLAFAFKGLDWLLLALEYQSASNKNADNTMSLVLKSAALVLIGFAVFGASIIGALVVPVVFAVALGMDAVWNSLKAVYFKIKAANAEDEHEKKFYSSKAKEAGTRAVVGFVAVAGVLLTLVFAAKVMAMVTIVAGIAVGTMLLGLVGLNIHKRVSDYRALKAAKKDEEKDKPEIKPEDTLKDQLSHQQKHEQAKQKALTTILIKKQEQQQRKAEDKLGLASHVGFYAHSIKLLKPVDKDHLNLDSLLATIAHQRNVIQQEMNEEKGSWMKSFLWSEEKKRAQKILALNFLESFLHVAEKLDEHSENIGDKKVVYIDHHPFEYENKQDLIIQTHNFVTSHFSGAFQSFFKETGSVETLFKYAYKLILHEEPQNVLTETENQSKTRHEESTF